VLMMWDALRELHCALLKIFVAELAVLFTFPFL
jgi:hypothetical protein